MLATGGSFTGVIVILIFVVSQSVGVPLSQTTTHIESNPLKLVLAVYVTQSVFSIKEVLYVPELGPHKTPATLNVELASGSLIGIQTVIGPQSSHWVIGVSTTTGGWFTQTTVM